LALAYLTVAASCDEIEIDAKYKDSLLKQMTPAQIEEAKKLSLELLKKIEANKKNIKGSQ